ncbi:methyl-accepting chemotaxis protein [Hydrogenophaga sp. T2]|uniref:methyl-accepting chemotaxis protein n=1 Tax=Hydrogenophaga sp. T2 TaxID=3132823 RepID=UPI003CE79627
MKVLSSLSQWWGRMSVRRQLYGSFAGVLLMMAGVGLAAMMGLQAVHTEALALSRKWLQGVSGVANARALLVEHRDLEIKHSLTGDASYHAEYEAKMGEAAKRLQVQFDAYRSRVAGAAEAELDARTAEAWRAYQNASAKVVQLGRDHQQQDAADVADGLASMAFDEVMAAFDRLYAHNLEGSEAAAATIETVYGTARTGMLSLLGGALAVSLLLATLIVRQLQRQLGGEPRVAMELARAVAEGRLDTPIVLRDGDTGSLLCWLRTMQHNLAQAVAEVRRCSDSVSHASSEIAAGNHDLSGRTERQASELQQTAATMEQLGTTVHHNADNARQACQLAQGASGVAVRGGEVVGRVVETMKGINESSRRINDIIGVIDSIAFQTNILALNAAVEAARAGEQGRGFAVVASEVRNLAKRSAEAAKEIKALIGTSVQRVEQGSVLVDQAGATMQEVVAAIRRVNDIVNEISAASAEQSHGVTQVGAAVARMDQSTQQNAALVEQSATAADSLQLQATQLVQAVAVFRLAA